MTVSLSALPPVAMRFATAVVLAVVLSGCFHVDSLLTVRPDGSATLRDEVTLSGMALMALAEDEETGESLFGEDVLSDRAATLGEGVRLASFERREDGFSAVYEVDDVRRLRYSTPETLGEEGERAGPESIDLSFGFDGGDPATLRVIVPKPKAEKPAEHIIGPLFALGDQPHISSQIIRQVVDQAHRTPAAPVIHSPPSKKLI